MPTTVPLPIFQQARYESLTPCARFGQSIPKHRCTCHPSQATQGLLPCCSEVCQPCSCPTCGLTGQRAARWQQQQHLFLHSHVGMLWMVSCSTAILLHCPAMCFVSE